MGGLEGEGESERSGETGANVIKSYCIRFSGNFSKGGKETEES